MHEITSTGDQSPFDALRKYDERGEYWSARDLMKPLGYAQWRNFADPIERARLSMSVNEQNPDVHVEVLAGARKNSTGRPGDDYRLTREGAYAVVQNCDIRKAEVAQAHGYFRTRTIEAEQGMVLNGVQMRNPALAHIVEVARQMQVTQDEQERLAAEQGRQARELKAVTQVVAGVDERVTRIEQVSPLADSAQLYTPRDVAHACDTGRQRLVDWLKAGGVLFEDQQGGLKAMQHPWMEKGWAVSRWERAQYGDHRWVWVTYFTAAGMAEVKRRWTASGLS